MSGDKPLRLTATQRLGKRVDRLDDAVRGHGLRLDGLAQRVQELAQTFAETAHTGNFEAMYRLEREENIRLRQNGRGEGTVGRDTLLRWIAELDQLCWQLDPSHLPPRATADAALTDEERRIVEKFGIELSNGVAGTPLAAQQAMPTEHCTRCGQLHPTGWHC